MFLTVSRAGKGSASQRGLFLATRLDTAGFDEGLIQILDGGATILSVQEDAPQSRSLNFTISTTVGKLCHVSILICPIMKSGWLCKLSPTPCANFPPREVHGELANRRAHLARFRASSRTAHLASSRASSRGPHLLGSRASSRGPHQARSSASSRNCALDLEAWTRRISFGRPSTANLVRFANLPQSG